MSCHDVAGRREVQVRGTESWVPEEVARMRVQEWRYEGLVVETGGWERRWKIIVSKRWDTRRRGRRFAKGRYERMCS